MNKIYVGNLPFRLTDDEFSEFFGAYGDVQSANIIRDRATGRSKGFGFVEFASDDQANAAVEQANGQELDGRQLRVSIANEQQGGRGGRGGRREGGDRW